MNDDNSELMSVLENLKTIIRNCVRALGDPEQYMKLWINVNIMMNELRPPTIELIAEGNRYRMDESTIFHLDWSQIQYADMVIRCYRYDPEKPISAWLSDLRIVAADSVNSDLESKYSGIPFAD